MGTGDARPQPRGRRSKCSNPTPQKPLWFSPLSTLASNPPSVSLLPHPQSDLSPKPFPGSLIYFGLHVKYVSVCESHEVDSCGVFPGINHTYMWWLRRCLSPHAHPAVRSPLRIQGSNVLTIPAAFPRLQPRSDGISLPIR